MEIEQSRHFTDFNLHFGTEVTWYPAEEHGRKFRFYRNVKLHVLDGYRGRLDTGKMN